jgi:methionine biosynthesis protein MetW
MASPDSNSSGFLAAADPLRYDAHSQADPLEVAGIFRSFLPDRARILDVGCGTGSLTTIVTKGKNAEVCGIEPDDVRAGVARSRGIDVFCGTLTEQYLSTRAPFDVILFADVLEHVPNPAALLRLAARGLKPNGIVLISVPNVAHWSTRLHLLRGHFDYTDIGIRDATHLRWFTLRTIENLLRSEGFEVLAYKPAAGVWMKEYNAVPWRLLPRRLRSQLIAALTRTMPPLFACQHVLKARLVSSPTRHAHEASE